MTNFPKLTWVNGRFFSIGEGRHDIKLSPSELMRQALETLLDGRPKTAFEYSPYTLIEAIRYIGQTGFDDAPLPMKLLAAKPDIAGTADHIEGSALRLLRLPGGAQSCDDLLVRCAQLRATATDMHAAMSDTARPMRLKLHGIPDEQQEPQKAYVFPGQTPVITCAGPRQDVAFGPETIAWYELCGIMARVLMLGSEVSTGMGGINLPIDYLVDMVRIIGKYGSFRQACDQNTDVKAPLLTREWLLSVVPA